VAGVVTSLEDLLRGAPAALLLRKLLVQVAEWDRDGYVRPPWTQDVSRALYLLSGAEGSELRTPPFTVGVVVSRGQVPVRDAARTLGLSEGYVQRLCRKGRVVASRAGWVWLVDLDSLRSVTGRTAA
jgi:hypothetical protein